MMVQDNGQNGKNKRPRHSPAPSESQSGSESDSSSSATASTSQHSKTGPINDTNGKKVQKQTKTFEELGLMPALVTACEELGITKPTPIQSEAIPLALQGRDVIGLAETGSGKTAAFSLPILQALWNDPQRLFGLILAPTRELADQICRQIGALGASMNITAVSIVGGLDMMQQAVALSKRPHIVVATPGRLSDHLKKTKGFNLNKIKFLVFDEADRLLDENFGQAIDELLAILPRERQTLLFSATMTTKVMKLQRTSLRHPVRVEVSSSKYSTVAGLQSYYLFFPYKQKEAHLVWLINECAGQTVIVFTRTVHDAHRTASILRHLGFGALSLHGQMSQTARIGALRAFSAKPGQAPGEEGLEKAGNTILVATDVASRGLDIPGVDMVINYDTPASSKDYIHRVGRTARAGRAGKAVTFVTQYDLELYQRIEAAVGKKLPAFPCNTEAVALLTPQVDAAHRRAVRDMQTKEVKKRR